VLSFLFDKEETAQVMTVQAVNLTVFIPWIIMIFVVEEKSLVAENLLSLIPYAHVAQGDSRGQRRKSSILRLARAADERGCRQPPFAMPRLALSRLPRTAATPAPLSHVARAET